jgi:serine/threonine-protein kinase
MVRMNDWNEVFGLLDQALDLPPDEYAAWLQSLHGLSADRRSQLEQLLAQEARLETADFLKSPVSLDDSALAAARTAGEPAADWTAGVRIGAYLLERELGQGGMGRVWLARRVDGQLDRRVALKLPFAGPFQRELMRRFARERDILAALAHPNIARLYDAGVTEAGQAYLALEYVEGLPITTFCDSRALTLDARLELFAQVLRAVSYAHANLVIHRDLKPSNILVTDAGEVRLLDFGIAKLMIGGEANSTELTEMAGRALTPDYASPEQIAGGTLNTSSDVYSLGVLLYELLTGERPYRLSRDSRAALEEAILSTDPLRPSQTVRAEHPSAPGGLSIGRWRRALAGDLDTITIKALKKRPAERYATVDALLQDIERHRRGEPVLARPDGVLYRCRKFLNRNRYAVVGALTAAAVLVAATVISVHQAHVAREQSSLAQREARRAQAVQQFLLDIFQTNSHLQTDPVKARQTTAREMLDTGAARIGASLYDVPEAQADVMMTLADMYTQMGMDSEAARLRLQRVEALKRARGPIDPDVAEALLDYVDDIDATRDRNLSLPVLREAGHIVDAGGDQYPEVRAEWWIGYGRYQRYSAPEKMREAADNAVKILQSTPREFLWTYPLALQLAALARVELGAYDDAEAIYERALAEVHRKEPKTSAWEILPFAQRAAAEAAQVKIVDAERDFRASLAISRKLNGDAHVETLRSGIRLGAFLYATSRRAEGRQLVQTAAKLLDQDPGKRGSFAAVFINTARGRIYFEDGQFDLSEGYLDQAVTDAREVYPRSSLLADALLTQGELYTAAGRLADAKRILTEALDMRRQVGGSAKDAALVNPFVLAEARLALARGDAQAAIDGAHQIRAPADAPRRPLLLDDLGARIVLAQAYTIQNRWDDAVREARAALDTVQRSPLRSYFRPLEADALLALGSALRGAGDERSACPLLDAAVNLRGALEDAASPRLNQARRERSACRSGLRQT